MPDRWYYGIEHGVGQRYAVPGPQGSEFLPEPVELPVRSTRRIGRTAPTAARKPSGVTEPGKPRKAYRLT